MILFCLLLGRRTQRVEVIGRINCRDERVRMPGEALRALGTIGRSGKVDLERVSGKLFGVIRKISLE